MEARANIMWAATIAHNNITGTGRAQDWEHTTWKMSFPALTVFSWCRPGNLFPSWMKYAMKEDVMRFAQFAVRVWGCEMDFQNPEKTALEGIERYQAFIKEIGMPTTISEIGGKEEDVPKLADSMFHGARITETS